MNKLKNNQFIQNKISIIILLVYIFAIIINLPIIERTINIQTIATNELKKYHYITRDTTLKIIDDKISGYITLPKTYYVLSMNEPNITIEGLTYKKVSYNSMVGLVNIEDISTNSIENITNPYFVPSETLSATNQENITLWLYNSIPKDSLDAVRLNKDIKLNYIAISSENTSYILVKTIEDTSRYGYVESNLYSPTIIQKPNPNPINPDTPIENPDLTPGDKDPIVDKTKTEKNIQAFLVIMLCVLVVFIIYLIFKPTSKKRASRDEFYDL